MPVKFHKLFVPIFAKSQNSHLKNCRLHNYRSVKNEFVFVIFAIFKKSILSQFKVKDKGKQITLENTLHSCCSVENKLFSYHCNFKNR